MMILRRSGIEMNRFDRSRRVPISGTPLESHPAPAPDFMRSLLAPLGQMLKHAGLRSRDIKAGCGKCGACSSLSVYES